jgi:hypothetical protein
MLATTNKCVLSRANDDKEQTKTNSSKLTITTIWFTNPYIMYLIGPTNINTQLVLEANNHQQRNKRCDSICRKERFAYMVGFLLALLPLYLLLNT